MNTLSVSTYSVREQLGPVDFTFVDPSGRDVHISFPFTKELDLSDFPARAKSAFGVGAIETVAFQFAGVDDPELDRFAAALRAEDVQLVNVAIDAGDLLEADAAKRAADVAEIERWIDRFAAMGSTFVRVNPGSPMAQHTGDDLPDHLVEALRHLGAYANARGSRLLVENHGGPSSDPAWMNRLLDAVGHEHLGLLLDLGNFDALMLPTMALLFGGPDGAQVTPEQVFAGLDLTSLYEGIEALAPRAELVHVKAHAVGDDGAVGPVDLGRALGILAAHGYSGPLTVEYEGTGGDPWAKSARVLEVAAASASEIAR
ncbi:sugar phosphate isomerase/epimerase family protein [Leifsonia naganoensis]|uniref:Sugar phosphate isomerase/epimerase n=1 Tax=Leifsonia naganoensis TaxID=150025 RepID=A0A853DSM2_9MICO|nr:sugar phosphate isomerase/epimerase family protein [Leifsonia naganoensis]NYK09381.1 sugar phosphate isomerase/epimerase [Leifsonia naganoensis]